MVGSGLGGLSAACLLAKYGESVTVCEAHTIAGGCAHSFDRRAGVVRRVDRCAGVVRSRNALLPVLCGAGWVMRAGGVLAVVAAHS